MSDNNKNDMLMMMGSLDLSREMSMKVLGHFPPDSDEELKQVAEFVTECIETALKGEHTWQEALDESDSDDPLIVVKEVIEHTYHNPHYGDGRLCECGHTYEKHFDMSFRPGDAEEDRGYPYSGCPYGKDGFRDEKGLGFEEKKVFTITQTTEFDIDSLTLEDAITLLDSYGSSEDPITADPVDKIPVRQLLDDNIPNMPASNFDIEFITWKGMRKEGTLVDMVLDRYSKTQIKD